MSKLPVHRLPGILLAEECGQGDVREENQDSVLHFHLALGELVLVADGLGESLNGASVAQSAIDYFYSHLSTLPEDYPADQALREADALANEYILSETIAAGPSYPQVGASIVAALLQQEGDVTHAWIGHIGDCRAYLLRAGRLSLLTNDHTAAEDLLGSNLIARQATPIHPDTSVMTRVLGQRPQVEMEIDQYPMAIGDTLLLCSIGLWGFVPEQEIQAAVDSITVEAAADTLLKQALSNGGSNIGLEIARIAPPPVQRNDHRRASLHPALWIFLGVFLLSFAVLCVLAYLAFFRGN